MGDYRQSKLADEVARATSCHKGNLLVETPGGTKSFLQWNQNELIKVEGFYKTHISATTSWRDLGIDMVEISQVESHAKDLERLIA